MRITDCLQVLGAEPCQISGISVSDPSLLCSIPVILSQTDVIVCICFLKLFLDLSKIKRPLFVKKIKYL